MYGTLILIFVIIFCLGYWFRIIVQIVKKIYLNAQIKYDASPPKFIKMGNDIKKRGNEMRLMYNSGNQLEYWRDAGEWGIKFRFEQRGLFKRVMLSDAKDYSASMAERLDGVLMTAISEDEWRTGNEGYLPSNYELELQGEKGYSSPVCIIDGISFEEIPEDELPF